MTLCQWIVDSHRVNFITAHQVWKMSLHNSLIHICLLSILQIFCNGEPTYVPLTSPKDLAAYPYLSPDRHGNSFAIVDFNFGLTEAENLYQVNLRIEDWENYNFKECSFNVTTKLALSMHVTVKTLRRLIGDDKKVVLAWNERRYDANGSYILRRIFAMDLDYDCRSKDLGLLDLPADPIVLPSDDGKFDAILAQPARIVSYNSDFEPVGRPKQFNVHLEWPTMRVERLRNGNYLVHGFDYRRVYKVILVDNSTGSTKKLLSLLDTDKSQLKVVSSGTTFCYNKNSSSDTSVDCSQFDERGDLRFERPTNFDVSATPLAVRELADGEFFLLVGDTNCTDEKSCWDLRRAKWLRRNDGSLNMSFSSAKFQCTGGWDSLVLYDVWRSDKLMYYSYGCKRGNRYVYHVTSFLAQ